MERHRKLALGLVCLSVLGGPAQLGWPGKADAATTVFEKQDLDKWSGMFSTEDTVVDVTAIALGLENPWGMSFLPDGAVLVTERPGRLRLAYDGQLGSAIEGVPEVYDGGQGGLLDVALDPNFADNQLIYLSFSELGNGGAGTAILRAQLIREGLEGRLEQQTVIFRQNIKSDGGRHFGSRLTFAPDGTLFATIGERGERERAQNKQDHAGSVIRINSDGSIPDDNPFLGDPDALPEFWSIGHRNPQGAAIHPETGQYWAVEHGARGGDELNLPEAGKNYGWPEISYGRHYTGFKIGQGSEGQGFEQPVHYWDPSIAPSGLAFYGSNGLESWRGNAFVGALKDQLISRLDVDISGSSPQIAHEEQWDMSKWGRIRDIDVDAAGNIWFLTDEYEGGIFKITPRDQ